jgi:hypothetical protein
MTHLETHAASTHDSSCPRRTATIVVVAVFELLLGASMLHMHTPAEHQDRESHVCCLHLLSSLVPSPVYRSLQQVSDQTHQGLGKVTLNPKVHLLTNDHCSGSCTQGCIHVDSRCGRMETNKTLAASQWQTLRRCCCSMTPAARCWALSGVASSRSLSTSAMCRW